MRRSAIVVTAVAGLAVVAACGRGASLPSGTRSPGSTATPSGSVFTPFVATTPWPTPSVAASPSPSASAAATSTPSSTATPAPRATQDAITFYTLGGSEWDAIDQLRSGPDGNLWFASWGMAPGSIGRTTTAGDVATWPIPWESGIVGGLAFGGGHVWTWDYHDGVYQIGEWNLDGKLLQEFPIRGVAGAMSWGPDGALWFGAGDVQGGHVSNAYIGRMTTGGEIKQYAMPDADALAEDMVVGPDNALWFSEAPGANIGRVTTSGVITEYAVPGTSVDQGCCEIDQTITVGSDGALWAVFGGEIIRSTTQGVVTVVPAKSPMSITSNPDGEIWYTDYHDSEVVAMTTSGATEATYPAGALDWVLGPIVTGPDGMIWYGGDGNILARLDPSIPPNT